MQQQAFSDIEYSNRKRAKVEQWQGEYLGKEYVNDELKKLQEKGFILTM